MAHQSYLRSQDPTLERSFRGHKDVITGLCFKPSMSQLASSSMDHSVMIWNFKPQLRAFRFVGHKAAVTSLDFNPAGNLLASSSRDKTIRLWTPNVKGDVTVFRAHTSTVRMVQFSHDGENLVTCSDDKSIKVLFINKLWSTNRTKFQYTLSGHLNWVRSVKYSPDSQLIVSGSDDKTIKLWDVRSKSCIKTYFDHSGIVTSVAFHPHGTMIASCSMDRSIKLFDIRTHKLVQHYGDAHGPASIAGQHLEGTASTGGGTNSVSFGGLNGEWLISTGMDGLVKVWDVHEGHLFYTLHGHKNGPTTSAVFSPQGDFFATGGSDSQVMVWKSNFDQVERYAGLESAPIHGNLHSPNPLTVEPEQTKARPKSTMSAYSARAESPVRGGMASLKVDDEPIKISAPIMSDVNKFEHSDRQEHVATSSLQVQTIPDQLSSTLSHMIRQIDILTQTMNILESRLTINEDKMGQVSDKLDLLLSQGYKVKSEKPNVNPLAQPRIPQESPIPNEKLEEFYVS